MSTNPRGGDYDVGYGKPPPSTRFQKGRSGNPRGRPRNRRREIPYDHVLGQMVTVLEDGRERRITAAEAFIMQLTKKGLQGDSTSARASLAAIEAARASRAKQTEHTNFRILFRFSGLCFASEMLGMAVRRNPTSKEHVRAYLRPWVVDAALARLADRQLTSEQQRVVIASVQHPEKVNWPAWWTEGELTRDAILREP